MPPEDDPAVHSAQDRIATALGVLAPDQWKITPVPGMLTANRDWSDGSRDTVIVLSPDSTYARRDDHAKNLVWQTRGTVETVVKAAQDLAPPKSPGAPRDPIRDPTEPPL